MGAINLHFVSNIQHIQITLNILIIEKDNENETTEHIPRFCLLNRIFHMIIWQMTISQLNIPGYPLKWEAGKS